MSLMKKYSYKSTGRCGKRKDCLSRTAQLQCYLHKVGLKQQGSTRPIQFKNMPN